MDKIHNILKEPIKAKIMDILMSGPSSFSEILRLSGLVDHGQLNYHLKQLVTNGLVDKSENYKVTSLGERMGIYLNQFQAKEMYPLPIVYPVIKNSKGEMLMLRRAKKPHIGHWVFPGGKIAIGETIKKAAERELLEETGIKGTFVKVIGLYPSIIYKEEELRFHVNLHIAEMEPVDDEIRVQTSNEHDDWMFCSVENSKNFLLVPVNRHILDNINKDFHFEEFVIKEN